MIVESSAPTRIDLAGGTVDIWPLYLFHRDALTINVAINLPARCRVSSRPDRIFVFHSKDTGETAYCDNLESLWGATKLRLIAKLVHFFSPSTGLEIVTDCSAPAGSGLAGSSALNI